MNPDERSAAILLAARELFSRNAYSDVSVADIAAAAGASPPLVVFYFGSKRALYVKVVQTAVDSIAAGLAAMPGPPSLDRLHASVRFYAEYARTHRAGFLSLHRAAGQAGLPEVTELVESLRTQLTDRILTDLAAGGSLPDDAATRVRVLIALRGYAGFVDAAITHWLTPPAQGGPAPAPDTTPRRAVGPSPGGLQAATAAPVITAPSPSGQP